MKTKRAAMMATEDGRAFLVENGYAERTRVTLGMGRRLVQAPQWDIPDQEFFLNACDVLVQERLDRADPQGALAMKWFQAAAQGKQIIIPGM